MSKNLTLFPTDNTDVSVYNETVIPQIYYYRQTRKIQYKRLSIKIICDNNIVSETYQCQAIVNGKKKTKIIWKIVESNEYATISSDGILTILPLANNSHIKISAQRFNTEITYKDCYITYSGGIDKESDVEVINNEDGTTTEIMTITTQNEDGTSSVSNTSIIYDNSGNTDGSYYKNIINYDVNGDPTTAENVEGDTLGNVNTQEVTYKNGEPIVSGYSIDTSLNTETGSYAIESTTEGGVSVDTKFIPFDGENGFVLDFHFKCVWDDQPKTPPVPDPKDSTYHYTIINFKREIKPWPGFALRAQNNNKNQIILSAVFDNGIKKTINIPYPSDNIFHIKFTYNPSIPNFTAYNVLTGNNILNENKIFKQLDDITVTIGCSMFNEANPPYPYRYANIDVYDFKLTKLFTE